MSSLSATIKKLKHRWRTRVSVRSTPVTHRGSIQADWAEHRYYEEAERPRMLATFWGPQSLFRRWFETLDLTNVIEVACGRGLHAAQIVDRVGRLTLVDVNEINIAACRERFCGRDNVAFLCNSGGDLLGMADSSATAVYCYDAMVHFEATDVIGYLAEFHRVLRPGGRSLLHYSNFDGNPGGFYRDNPGHRNFFSEKMMRHFADRAGHKVLEHAVFPWALGPDGPPTDGLILLQR
jgi:SAM-dependent methyltransferase